MMDKAKNSKLSTNSSHAWVCGHQSHKTKNKIRLIRFLLIMADMEEEGLHEND